MTELSLVWNLHQAQAKKHFQQCTKQEITEYIERCGRSIFRWLTFSKLKKVSIQVVDANESVVASYVVRFYPTSASGHRHM